MRRQRRTAGQRIPSGPKVVVVGGGFAGLSALSALQHSNLDVTLVDRNVYSTFQPLLYQVATAGLTSADVAYALWSITRRTGARFHKGLLTKVDAERRTISLDDGFELPYDYLILATGVSANFFGIPGADKNSICMYTRSDAVAVRERIMDELESRSWEGNKAGLSITIAGGGATGVELAGELAETLPKAASRYGLAPDLPSVRLVEAGPTILAGSSPQLIDKAARILSDLGVRVRTNATIAAATEEGFRLTDGQLVEGGVFVWAGGLKAPGLVADSELPTGHNGRVKVDRYLRVLDHPEIYVAGDLASVTDPRTGHVLPPLAQVALEEGETVARNLDAELEDKPLEAFTFRDKGFVVSVGTRRGVADIAGITTGGRLAHGLKDAIEWEYRQSVKHLRGWDPV